MLFVAFLAVVATAEEPEGDSPMKELQKTEEMLQGNADSDVPAEAFGAIDSKLAELKEKFAADAKEVSADDLADGVDASQYPVVDPSAPMSLLQTSPDASYDNFAKVEARLQALEGKIQADGAKFSAAAKDADAALPSSLLQEDPDAGFAKVEAKLKALQEKIKADTAKFEQEAKPSSFAQVSSMDDGFDQIKEKLDALRRSIAQKTAAYHRTGHFPIPRAASSFLEAPDDGVAGVQAKLLQLEKLIKSDVTKFKATVKPSSLAQSTEKDGSADLLQQMQDLAEHSRKMGTMSPTAFKQTAKLDALSDYALRGYQDQLQKGYKPTSFVQQQMETLLGNLRTAKQVVAGESRPGPSLLKMLSGFRAKDAELKKEAAQMRLPKGEPAWMRNDKFPESFAETHHKWGSNPKFAEIKDKLNTLVAKLEGGHASSLAQTGATSRALGNPKVQAQLKDLIGKISAFTDEFRLEHKELGAAKPSSLLEESKIPAFAKLDKLRADLVESQGKLVDVRKMMPFADANADADIHLRATEAKDRQDKLATEADAQ